MSYPCQDAGLYFYALSSSVIRYFADWIKSKIKSGYKLFGISLIRAPGDLSKKWDFRQIRCIKYRVNYRKKIIFLLSKYQLFQFGLDIDLLVLFLFQ